MTKPINQPRSVEAIINKELAAWRDLGMLSSNTFRGYQYAAKSFLAQSGRLAQIPGYKYTKSDISDIVDRMVANNPEVAHQKLRNVRCILRRTAALPENLIGEVQLPKPKCRGRRT